MLLEEILELLLDIFVFLEENLHRVVCPLNIDTSAAPVLSGQGRWDLSTARGTHFAYPSPLKAVQGQQVQTATSTFRNRMETSVFASENPGQIGVNSQLKNARRLGLEKRL